MNSEKHHHCQTLKRNLGRKTELRKNNKDKARFIYKIYISSLRKNYSISRISSDKNITKRY